MFSFQDVNKFKLISQYIALAMAYLLECTDKTNSLTIIQFVDICNSDMPFRQTQNTSEI